MCVCAFMKIMSSHNGAFWSLVICHVLACTLMYVCMHACICMHMHACICVCVCVCGCVVCVRLREREREHADNDTHACMHIHIHTHIHTYTHMHSALPGRGTLTGSYIPSYCPGQGNFDECARICSIRRKVYIYTHTYTHSQTYIHIHTHIHTHMHSALPGSGTFTGSYIPSYCPGPGNFDECARICSIRRKDLLLLNFPP